MVGAERYPPLLLITIPQLDRLLLKVLAKVLRDFHSTTHLSSSHPLPLALCSPPLRCSHPLFLVATAIQTRQGMQGAMLGIQSMDLFSNANKLSGNPR